MIASTRNRLDTPSSAAAPSISTGAISSAHFGSVLISPSPHHPRRHKSRRQRENKVKRPECYQGYGQCGEEGAVEVHLSHLSVPLQWSKPLHGEGRYGISSPHFWHLGGPTVILYAKGQSQLHFMASCRYFSNSAAFIPAPRLSWPRLEWMRQPR